MMAQYPKSKNITGSVCLSLFMDGSSKGRHINGFIFILILTLSADIESNPGPKYPCGACNKNVLDTDPVIVCDNCNNWYHILCENFSENLYTDLVSSNQSFSWLCTKCESINMSTSINSSLSSLESQNSFSLLSDPLVPPTAPHLGQTPIITSKKNKAKNFLSNLRHD